MQLLSNVDPETPDFGARRYQQRRASVSGVTRGRLRSRRQDRQAPPPLAGATVSCASAFGRDGGRLAPPVAAGTTIVPAAALVSRYPRLVEATEGEREQLVDSARRIPHKRSTPADEEAIRPCPGSMEPTLDFFAALGVDSAGNVFGIRTSEARNLHDP